MCRVRNCMRVLYQMGVKGSARQCWAADRAPTDLQDGPTNGVVVNTLLPIPCVPVASPGLTPKGEEVYRADAPGLPKWTDSACAAKPIDAATPGLGASVCYPPTNRHHGSLFARPAQPAPGECRLNQPTNSAKLMKRCPA